MDSLLTPEVVTAVTVFAAVVAAQFLKGGLRMLQAWVKKTPTSFDDKILNAVLVGIDVALREKEMEEKDDKPPLRLV